MADNSVPYSILAIMTAILTLSIVVPSIFVHNDHLFVSVDTPTKLEFGVNITIKPITRIYDNRSEHFYLMKLPTGGKHYDLTNDRISSTTEIYSVDAFPLYNPETVELIVGEVTNGTNEENTTTFNVTRDYFKFDIGSRTTTIDSDNTRFWALRLITPQFADGYFNITLQDGESIEIDPDISACGTLSTANAEYTLTGDITDDGVTCLTVGAENITIDCAGYSITGDNTTLTYGVYSNQVNTTVKNCDISNFSAGIYISGDSADYANITNNTINLTYSTSCSQTTGACNGIFVKSADNSIINENTINVYRFGINLYSSATNNIVQYNNVASSDDYSIYLFSNANINIIQYNNATGGDDYAVYNSGCDHNTIQYNNLMAIDGQAVYITNSDNITVLYNNLTASRRTIYLFSNANNNFILYNNITANSNTVILATTSSNNLFDNNNITSNTYSIYIGDSGNDFNNFTNNTIDGSGTTAIFWTDADDGTGNRFVENNITADVWIDDKEAGNFFNDSEGVGNIYYFSNGTGAWEVYDITASSGVWADGGDDVPLNASLTEWTGLGNDSHPYAGLSPPELPSTNPYIWDGDSWIPYLGENMAFRCSIDGVWPAWCQPTNQNNLSSQPILRIQNNDSGSSEWQAIRTNATWGVTATMYCGNNTNPLIESVNVTTSLTNYSTEELAGGSNRSLYCALRISSIPADFQRTFNMSFLNG